MVHVSVVYHSGYGHTEKQAQAVLAGVQSVEGVQAHIVNVADMDAHWETLEKSQAIIFGSPTYMGSVSGPFKMFMDATSKVWMEQKWKNKLAAGFTNSGSLSGDKLNTLIQMAIFAAQHSMIWVGLDLMPGSAHSNATGQELNRLGSFLGAMSQSNVDQGADQTPPEWDLKTAERLGQRVAELAKGWKSC